MRLTTYRISQERRWKASHPRTRTSLQDSIDWPAWICLSSACNGPKSMRVWGFRAVLWDALAWRGRSRFHVRGHLAQRSYEQVASASQLHQDPSATTTSASLKHSDRRARRSEETPYQSHGLEKCAKQVMSAALMPAACLPVGAETAAGQASSWLPGNDARWDKVLGRALFGKWKNVWKEAKGVV